MTGRKLYFLIILTLIYMSNYIDRVAIGIFAEPIKRDLELTDTQLGLISGVVFALFYAVLGIPLGRLADRFNRKIIISSCLSIWSFATAMGGLCQGFAQLALTRMLVGVGEAGCTPTAHSLLSDTFPPDKRATAISIYSMGVPLGIIAGAIGGSWIAHLWGWRIGLIALGLPGLLLALIVMLTIKEPERGLLDSAQAVTETPPLREVLRTIVGSPIVIAVLFGIGFCAVGLYSISSFTVPFLIRAYDLDILAAGQAFGLSYGVAGALGALFGGMITDWAGARDMRWYTGVPALVYLVSGPLMAFAFFQSDLASFLILFTIGALVVNVALAPAVSVLINQVSPRMRGSMSAIALFFSALVGNGFGPTLTGYLSDNFAAASFGSRDYFELCHASTAKVGGSYADACAQASYQGIQYALSVAAAFWLVSAAFYLFATFGPKRSASPAIG